MAPAFAIAVEPAITAGLDGSQLRQLGLRGAATLGVTPRNTSSPASKLHAASTAACQITGLGWDLNHPFNIKIGCSWRTIL